MIPPKLVCLLTLIASFASLDAYAAKHPNIVMLLSDDLGYRQGDCATLGNMGN